MNYLRYGQSYVKAQVVVTDRLHGMIFCAITKTPCVVLRSFDHKVMEGV
ncbi:polysaccharide pyruvyl transferase family protein [Bacillus sp. SL00103]